jgi:hypothetical protein
MVNTDFYPFAGCNDSTYEGGYLEESIEVKRIVMYESKILAVVLTAGK